MQDLLHLFESRLHGKTDVFKITSIVIIVRNRQT